MCWTQMIGAGKPADRQGSTTSRALSPPADDATTKVLCGIMWFDRAEVAARVLQPWAPLLGGDLAGRGRDVEGLVARQHQAISLPAHRLQQPPRRSQLAAQPGHVHLHL